MSAFKESIKNKDKQFYELYFLLLLIVLHFLSTHHANNTHKATLNNDFWLHGIPNFILFTWNSTFKIY